MLGSCGGWPEPGRACSGFLLESAGFRVVVDLGYGTLPRLLSLLESPAADGLDAVVITHEHPDHVVDLHGLFRARWFGRRGAPSLPLYAPREVFDRLQAFEDGTNEALIRVFEPWPLPARPYRCGPFRLDSVALPHFVPNAGVRLASSEATVVYTGDTGPDPAVVELASEADLFVAEATDRHQRPGVAESDSDRRCDLTAREAAALAARAHAERLLLTHFRPGNDREVSRAEAAEVFPGDTLVATEGLRIPLS
ncbi:ribonuclease BN (tRNA processing enzyme) [Actinopolyspora biskrensis]|uniref:Ribonuclease BN (tRNA processing enzyme) n=1 Tax=Actinopolyspora biskrensis TaxID=1470178 RepID=A0A852Z0Z5_9ACTN|nr:ribonuclease BN (tRNA processing enzyme) [Actinopolyspora biskrensis]